MISEKIEAIISLHENRWKLLEGEDRLKIGWLSIGTPEEIIYAADMIPYRITGETRPKSPRASSIMSRNLCPYVLSCLEEELDGVHRFSSGSVIVNACDARRRLYDVWKYYDGAQFLHIFDFPKVVNPESKKYFRQELKQLIKVLEEQFHCNITDDSLKEAISLCNETRALLREFYELRKISSTPILGSQAIAIVKASMTGLRKEYNQKLGELVECLKKSPKVEQNRHRVLLCGSFFDHTNIAQIYEANGANIVCEDTSVGVKYWEGQVDLEGDPLSALASYYLDKATCARMTDTDKRFNHLWNLVEDYNIESVVYFSLKFCDNNLHDFPLVKKKLEARGIPVFFIEAERSVENIEQIKTRVVAFLENHVGYGSVV